jgi:hypothetical protein
MTKRNIQWYGWKPDLMDKRDRKYAAPRAVLEALPPSADLSGQCPPVYDQGALGSCHDDKTEVLTERGWKLFCDVPLGEKLATVSKDGNVFFVVPERLVSFEYKGPMFYVDRENLNFCVTPDHKMFVRRWDESKRTLSSTYQLTQMKNIGWYSGLMSSAKTDNSEIETISIDGVDHKRKHYRTDKVVPANLWLNFLGFYLAEGTLCPHRDESGKQLHYKIQIATGGVARKEQYCLGLLTQMAKCGLIASPCVLKDRITLENKQIYEAIRGYGLEGIHSPFKFVPDFVFGLGSNNISALLEGHAMGDGCEQKGHLSYYTSSIRLADDLQRLVFLSGGWCAIAVRPPRASQMTDGRIVRGRFPEYRVGTRDRKGLSLDREIVSQIPYEGMVYCAEVSPYHTLVTRRNGKMLISGNCTANAIGAAFQFEQMKQDASKAFVPSRLFVYWNERDIEGSIDDDSGAEIRDGIKSVVSQGVCPETMWPYDINRFRDKPPDACYADALRNQVESYLRIEQDSANGVSLLDQMRGCIASGYPFVFGFTVYDSFESSEVERTGVLNMPKPNEGVCGGHAVLAVGYDDATKRFKVRNSWGEKWGIVGYFTIPYEYLIDPDLAADMWTIRFVEIDATPDPVPTPDPEHKWPCDMSLFMPATKAFVDGAVSHADRIRVVSRTQIGPSADGMLEAGFRGLQDYLNRVEAVRQRKG